MNRLDRLFANGGILFLLAICGHLVSQWGTHWEFGRYGMPRTLVGASGMTHPDGSPIDPLTLAMLHSGIEEDVMLGLCGILAVLLVMLILTVRKGIAVRKQLAAAYAESARLNSLASSRCGR